MDPTIRNVFEQRYGVVIRQNYGTSETGNISLYTPKEVQNCEYVRDATYKGEAWGDIRVEPARNGALLNGESGELVVHVPWLSEGYVVEGRLQHHGNIYRTGDAGHVLTKDGVAHVFASRRLRPPVTVHFDSMRILLQVNSCFGCLYCLILIHCVGNI